MEQVSLTLRQMSQALNCSERTLYRRCKDSPETVPPFTHGKRWSEWRFPYPAFQAWLEKRARLRAEYAAPHLRWCEAPRRNPEAAVRMRTVNSLNRAIKAVLPENGRAAI